LTEREWREASDLRTSRVGLAIVLITAAVLRFWALGHRIPWSVEVDEPEIVERAIHMMRSGSLNPNFFDYPGLYIYVQLLVSIVHFVLGALGGAWSSLDQAHSPSFYYWGRAVTATVGTVTTLLVYQIGLRWGGRHALLAAGLFAVMPLHVRSSHYVLTDTPLTFFTTLTMLLSLVAHEKGTLRAFAWAGAAAGLAAATKYNGGVALLMPLLACWMTMPARPSRLACAFGTIAAAAGAFLLAAPYTLLALPQFLNAFARLATMYRDNPPPPEPAAIIYLKHLLRSVGWPAVLLALGGLIMGVVRIVRGPGRVRWTVLVGFALAYFWVIADQNIIYARYMLPIVPPFCILAAISVVSGVSLLRRYEIPRAPRTALIVGLTIAALAPPAWNAIAFDRMIGRRGTLDQAYEWIVANVPKDARIVVETRQILLGYDGYSAENMPQLRFRSYDDYRAGNVDYLVASSQSFGPYLAAPQASPREYAEYMRIFTQAREVARFTPTAGTPGPELRILKVRP
jgi:4-amino-4-deoxy-L-arabinose transferase-like glycosyltransferase